MSALAFNPQGLICLHQDHWDAASHFYQQLPLLGWLLRQVKRRIQV